MSLPWRSWWRFPEELQWKDLSLHPQVRAASETWSCSRSWMLIDLYNKLVFGSRTLSLQSWKAVLGVQPCTHHDRLTGGYFFFVVVWGAHLLWTGFSRAWSLWAPLEPPWRLCSLRPGLCPGKLRESTKFSQSALQPVWIAWRAGHGCLRANNSLRRHKLSLGPSVWFKSGHQVFKKQQEKFW